MWIQFFNSGERKFLDMSDILSKVLKLCNLLFLSKQIQYNEIMIFSNIKSVFSLKDNQLLFNYFKIMFHLCLNSV